MSEPRAQQTSQRVPISPGVLAAILARHGIEGRPIVHLAKSSAGNTIYMLGEDLVLRMPHERADNDYGLEKTRIAISAARSVGVRTPQIVAYDDTRELVPAPYVILEQVPGEPLSKQEYAPSDIPQVWRELAHDLARLHHGVRRDEQTSQLDSDGVKVDPRPWLEELIAQGRVSSTEAAWLRRWLDELEPLARTGEWLAFCHGDMSADNVLVRPATFDYLAIVDWDGAGWMDPVWDFVPLPMRAVPLVLRAYREVAEVPGDTTAEARILWHHVQYAIFIWWRRRDQGRAIVEQGLPRLRSGIRGMLELPGARWMAHLA